VLLPQCRDGLLELVRNGKRDLIPVDPDGRHGLTGAEADPYGIEIATVPAAVAGGQRLEFGRDDAVAQATAYEALLRAATTGAPVDL
jgi:hypothetical protein